MPIPAFDNILNIIPPYLVDSTHSSNHSPYQCNTEELCIRFATSPARKKILAGFLDLRSELMTAGLRGFQWLDGSFVENIENQELRPPNDIDVVTFAGVAPTTGIPATSSDVYNAIIAVEPKLLDRGHVKLTYAVDHFFVPLASNPRTLVYVTRFWYGLFSHRRGDELWKGMLTVNLNDPADDHQARIVLGAP